MTRISVLFLSLFLVGGAAAEAQSDMTTTPSGLQYRDIEVGEGSEAVARSPVVVHYTGWIWMDGERGAKIDSSLDRSEPLQFVVGGGSVIRGWDEGVQGMRVGGRRVLIIPPELAYGSRGVGNVVPPDATLIFEIELLNVLR